MRFFTILVENFDGSQRPIRWPKRPKTIGGDGREAIAISMTGRPYALNRFPSPPKLRGEAMPNKGCLIAFL
jgi:hypothetical protein